MRQRGDRQPQAERGIARRQKQIAAPQLPALAAPARACRRPRSSAGSAARSRSACSAPDRTPAPCASALPDRTVWNRSGSTFGGRPASFCSQWRGSSNAGMMNSASTPSFRRGAFRETLGVVDVGLARPLDLRDQIGILPDRHAVLAPVEAERPARQAFAGIPFALAVMQQAARREARAQPADQIVGERRAWSGRPRRYSIPAIPDRRSRRRSARRPWSGARRRP